jgi:hypothetical protein
MWVCDPPPPINFCVSVAVSITRAVRRSQASDGKGAKASPAPAPIGLRMTAAQSRTHQRVVSQFEFWRRLALLIFGPNDAARESRIAPTISTPPMRTAEAPTRRSFPDASQQASSGKRNCKKCPVLLARSERFELPTLGFEVRCSIQLSYERVRHFNGLAGRPFLRH